MEIQRRGFVAGVGALALGISAPAAAAEDEGSESLGFIDPQLRGAARQALQFSRGTPLSIERLPAVRPMGASFALPTLPQPVISERRIPVGPGSPEVTIYIVNADPRGHRPAVIHLHGGGFILGAAKWDLRRLQDMALALDCVVVTVEYRLAPETTYRGSIEDNYAALKWLYANAASLGVDRTRIAVAGGSAGGGHAALLALTARDRGEVPLMFQLLIYPMLDDRTGSGRMPPSPIGTIGWSGSDNRLGWRCFLGQEPGGARAPRGAVPARVGDLRGLPPAFIGVGAVDLFVSEDVEYGRRLIEAGVPVDLLVVPGAFHGFDIVAPEASVSKRFSAAGLDALRRAFAGSAKA